jgi:UDP-N-acetylglucosamine:LPS N-acetylglucosamine transferase
VRILIASTPATGHLNPLLAIGRILIAEGHEIVCVSGNALRERIESIGAKFRPLPAGANFRDMVVPELKNIPPGLEWLRVAMERLLVDIAADIIIGDDMFFGVLPKLLGPRSKRPPLCFVARRFCTGAAKTGRRIFSACHPQPPRHNSGNTRLSLKNTIGSSISQWPVV